MHASGRVSLLKSFLADALKHYMRPGVTEGRNTGGIASTPYSSPAKAGSTNYDIPIFRSAKDTLRDVYSSSDGFRAPQSSPNKRGRAKSEEPEGHNGTESSDVDMDATATEADALPSFCINGGPRPIKSLKRSGRTFAQTRSLPVGSEQMRLMAQPQHLDTHTMDDDWSAVALDSSTKPLELDIDF